jgi:transcriptional regulator with XRE-family HTH domain
VAYLRNQIFISLVGNRIKELRYLHKKTQEDVAFEIGIEITQLSRIENGKINTSISQICEIAKAIGVEPKEIFTFPNDCDY